MKLSHIPAHLLVLNPDLELDTPGKRAIKADDFDMLGSEHAHQVELFAWRQTAVHKYPELARLYAVPNGGHRHYTVALKLQAEGAQAGVWDVALDVARGGYHGFRGEMKYGKNKLTPAQEGWGEFYRQQGYYTAVAWRWQDMADEIERYLEL